MRSEKLDLIRGSAIIGMTCFHANYLLENVFDRDILPISDSIWWVIGKLVAILFILVSGASFGLMSERKGMGVLWIRTFRRVLELSLAAFTISLGTYFFYPSQMILWGILHFFALASLIAPVCVYFRGYNILIGVCILIFGLLSSPLGLHNALLIPLGYPPVGFFSADYYPLIPWFGYFLIGLGMTQLTEGTRWREKILGGRIRYSQGLIWIGRHALLIYLIHVPILYGIFSIFL